MSHCKGSLMTKTVFSLAAACLVSIASETALAQVGPSILIQPWETPQIADTENRATFYTKGHDQRSDGDMHLWTFQSQGRFKLDAADNDPPVVFGYRYVTLDTQADIAGLPDEYSDISAVAAMKLGQPAHDWTMSLLGGIGSSNDNHWDNGDAIYGIGTLDAQWRIADDMKLNVGLSYNGNRAILPDIPLPYAAFTHRLDETFRYTIGVPLSAIQWRPIEPLQIDVKYLFVDTFDLRATWHFTKQLSTFLSYDRQVEAFHVEHQDNDRIFYKASQARWGMRYQATKWFDLEGGLGYGFGQEFLRGFDMRDTDTIAEPSDQLFFFLALRSSF